MQYTECWFKPICDRYPEGCSEKCIDFTTMVFLTERARIPQNRWFPPKLSANKDRLAHKRLNEIKLDIYDIVQAGENFLLHSKFAGNGKTTWATKLMLAYFSTVSAMGKYPRGIFINVPLFLMQYKRNIGTPTKDMDDVINLILRSDLVVWDDIASNKYTDYEYSVLLPLIDARIFAGRSNIFTANGEYDELLVRLGGRLGSRVVFNSECIEFIGEDNRGLYGRATNII